MSESRSNGFGQLSRRLQGRLIRSDLFLMAALGTNSHNGKARGATLANNFFDPAGEAGLQYVSDDRPGYTRRANDGEFDYLDTQGKQIRDERRLLRIKRLAIPPAWTDVWICPSANGHIQATGRDARRRKQY